MSSSGLSVDAKDKLMEPFINACRLCLWKREKMIHFGQSMDVITKINACLPTSVSETDELPKHICCECFYKLNMTYEFHKMCGRSDYILKSYILKNSQPVLSNKVEERENESCVGTILPFKRCRSSETYGEDPAANEQCLDVIKTEEQEMSFICGVGKFSSSSKKCETLLPSEKVTGTKVEDYFSSIEYRNNKELEVDSCFGKLNNGSEEVRDSEDGITPTSHLTIESVYTIASENKENVSHVQPGQLSDMFCETLDCNRTSKRFDDNGKSSKTCKQNSVCEADVNSKVSKECNSENYSEIIRSVFPNSSTEINSINDQKVTLMTLNRHDELRSSAENHTDRENVIEASNTVFPGYSSEVQDSEKKIKREYENTSHNDSLRQKESNNLEHKCLSSTSSQVIQNSSNCKSYSIEREALIWKEWLKLHGQKTFKYSKVSQCHVCQKMVKNAYSLRRHMLIHTGEKPYKCPYCIRSFAFSFGFSIHIRTHTGERPYKCNDCNKGFMDKPSLKTHIKKHIGVTPYGCNICQKQFYTRGSLSSHEKVHSELYAFCCCECCKDFKRLYSLNLHMRLHTGFRPFKCPECDHTFVKSAHLKQHLRIHTGWKPFKCAQCSKSFSQYSNYRRHIRRHVKGAKVENNIVRL